MTRGKVSGTERAMGPASSGIRGIRSFYDEMGIGKEELLRGTGPGGGGRGRTATGSTGPVKEGPATPPPRRGQQYTKTGLTTEGGGEIQERVNERN